MNKEAVEITNTIMQAAADKRMGVAYRRHLCDLPPEVRKVYRKREQARRRLKALMEEK